MKIQQVSAKTGLSIHTLRYYEQTGLVTPIARAPNGHRDYTDDDVYRILFVTHLRTAGMPIADIRRYVEIAQQDSSTVLERLHLLEAHQASIEQKIGGLRQHLGVISRKIDHYRETHKNQFRHRKANP